MGRRIGLVGDWVGGWMDEWVAVQRYETVCLAPSWCSVPLVFSKKRQELTYCIRHNIPDTCAVCNIL